MSNKEIRPEMKERFSFLLDDAEFYIADIKSEFETRKTSSHVWRTKYSSFVNNLEFLHYMVTPYHIYPLRLTIDEIEQGYSLGFIVILFAESRFSENCLSFESLLFRSGFDRYSEILCKDFPKLFQLLKKKNAKSFGEIFKGITTYKFLELIL